MVDPLGFFECGRPGAGVPPNAHLRRFYFSQSSVEFYFNLSSDCFLSVTQNSYDRIDFEPWLNVIEWDREI